MSDQMPITPPPTVMAPQTRVVFDEQGRASIDLPAEVMLDQYRDQLTAALSANMEMRVGLQTALNEVSRLRAENAAWQSEHGKLGDLIRQMAADQRTPCTDCGGDHSEETADAIATIHQGIAQREVEATQNGTKHEVVGQVLPPSPEQLAGDQAPLAYDPTEIPYTPPADLT